MGGVAEPRPARASGVDVDRLHTKSSLSWPKPNDRALRPNARLSGVPGDTRGLPEIPRPSYGSRFDRAERATSEPACHLQDALHGLQRSEERRVGKECRSRGGRYK